MDDSKFDAITMGLATGRSRRSLLRGLIGGGAAVVVARSGRVLAEPDPKVDICHLGKDGIFHLVSVSTSAIPAHEPHGDGYLGSDEHCSVCGDACEAGCVPSEVVRVLTMLGGDQFAVDTGVSLAAGESIMVTIAGTGYWCCGGGGVDADGDALCGNYGMPFNCGSIVGVIGAGDIFTDWTPFFPVGTGPIVVTAATAGNLYLQYVDGCPGTCYYDNTGEFTVTITTAPTCAE